jgi:uncharacterized protein
MVIRILLDTSALMIPGNFGVDIFTEIDQACPGAELYTLTTAVNELRELAQNRGKKGAAARLALQLIDIKNVKVYSAKGHTDNTILQMEDFAVATTDTELIEKLKERKRRIIYLKGKSRLGFWPEYWVEE